MGVNIGNANREAVDRLCRARPRWTAVRPAREALALAGQSLLHAGPPIGWERMCSPMRGAVTAAMLFEGWAKTPEDAAAGRGLGRGRLQPLSFAGRGGTDGGRHLPEHAHARGGGPGEREPPPARSSPTVRGGTSSGLAPAGRRRWRASRGSATWWRRVPGRSRTGGAVDLASLMSQALGMGDEMHMRNAAATGLLARQLAAPLAAVVADRDQLQAILRFVTRDNDQFFLAWSMCAAKAAARSIEGLEGSTVVSAMARNGVEFGIQVAGLGDRWFTGPASTVDGLYFPGFGAGDANRDTGDSAIMETYGLGGMAMAASPAVQKIVGAKSFADAVATSRSMSEICVGTNPLFPLAPLNGEGTPTGIDVRKVVRSGIVPPINTAIAHRSARRMIGAGIATPPVQPFVDALVAFGEAYRP